MFLRFRKMFANSNWKVSLVSIWHSKEGRCFVIFHAFPFYGCMILALLHISPESSFGQASPDSGGYQNPFQSGESLRETRRLRWGTECAPRFRQRSRGFPVFLFSCVYLLNLFLFVSEWFEDVSCFMRNMEIFETGFCNSASTDVKRLLGMCSPKQWCGWGGKAWRIFHVRPTFQDFL